MMKKRNLTDETFGALLEWLSKGDKEPIEEYKIVRGRLISYFEFKGCDDPITLADKTIDRFAQKVYESTPDNEIKYVNYAFGIAKNVYFEYLKKNKEVSTEIENTNLDVNKSAPSSDILSEMEFNENKMNCMRHCLKGLKAKDKRFLTEYYELLESKQIDYRQNLAQKHNISLNNLRVKIYRLKDNLRNCLKNCMSDKKL